MLTVNEAQKLILESCTQSTEAENVDLYSALGRVTAREYHSPINVPPDDNSAMDGFAVKSADLKKNPTSLEVSQRIPAGRAPLKFSAGTAARIFTGGILPEGADAVVMQEDCYQLEDGSAVEIRKEVKAGENVRPRGQDVREGALLFRAGHCLRPQDVALLASVGIGRVSVHKKPRVALLGTGDELVEPGKPLEPGQIYNSNKFMLSGLLTQLGCEVISPGETAVRDNLNATVEALRAISDKVDLIISTGGVSVGEEDYIRPAIAKLGEIESWKIKLKPGKPLVLGRVNNTRIIGLPGNPVSSFVTFLLFVAPLLRKMQGLELIQVDAQALPLGFAIEKARQRPEFRRVRVENGKVIDFDNQSSGVLSSTVWANALALIPEETVLAEGDQVIVYFLNQLMNQALT